MAAQRYQLNFILGFQGQTAKPVFDVLILINKQKKNHVICPSSVLETQVGAQSEGFPLFANLSQQDWTAR